MKLKNYFKITLHLCSALIRNPLGSYYFSGHELHLSLCSGWQYYTCRFSSLLTTWKKSFHNSEREGRHGVTTLWNTGSSKRNSKWKIFNISDSISDKKECIPNAVQFYENFSGAWPVCVPKSSKEWEMKRRKNDKHWLMVSAVSLQMNLLPGIHLAVQTQNFQ